MTDKQIIVVIYALHLHAREKAETLNKLWETLDTTPNHRERLRLRADIMGDFADMAYALAQLVEQAIEPPSKPQEVG